MKLLALIPGADFYGQERSALNILKSSSVDKKEVFVALNNKSTAKLTSKFSRYQRILVDYGPLWNYGILKPKNLLHAIWCVAVDGCRLRKYIKDQGVKMIYFGNIYVVPILFLTIIFPPRRIKLIYRLGDNYHSGPWTILYKIVKYFHKDIFVFSNCDYVKLSHVHLNWKIATYYNVWNGEVTHCGNEKLTFAFVGQWHFEKGFSIFVDLVKSLPDSNFVIFGSKSYIGNSNEMVDIKNYLKMLPNLSVYEHSPTQVLMSSFHVLVAPLIRDIMPNIVFESIVHGKVVISTNVGGISEICVHNESIYFAEINDFRQNILFLEGKSVEEVVLTGERFRQNFISSAGKKNSINQLEL